MLEVSELSCIIERTLNTERWMRCRCSEQFQILICNITFLRNLKLYIFRDKLIWLHNLQCDFHTGSTNIMVLQGLAYYNIEKCFKHESKIVDLDQQVQIVSGSV